MNVEMFNTVIKKLVGHERFNNRSLNNLINRGD